uniref:Uncharacterized protein n=1 Tax=Arundo donax TaxID=35708 RepID=A0A0A8ZB58_ARUDO
MLWRRIKFGSLKLENKPGRYGWVLIKELQTVKRGKIHSCSLNCPTEIG